MKRIAVLTSGGDAPGMNAAVRSVVRCAVYSKLDIFGIRRGYEGLLDNDIFQMNARSVSNILTRGGTILKTSRSKRFFEKSWRKKAADNLRKRNIESLIVIGGNGSFKGADLLSKESGINIIGVPGTIDNDICGSDNTIGASTAVGTALDAIDKIRDTVTSMERIYVVEVMGRDDPFIAIRVGLAGGAEDVLYPDNEYDIDEMCGEIKKGRACGKMSWIIIVSEGVAGAKDVSDIIKEKTGFGVRPVVLGHIQRGGSPSAFDRILASRLGALAVNKLLEGKHSGMVGLVADQDNFVDFETACKHDARKLKLDREIYKLTRILAI